jgi:predicted lipid-binding transport protein (Tim44 family)
MRFVSFHSQPLLATAMAILLAVVSWLMATPAAAFSPYHHVPIALSTLIQNRPGTTQSLTKPHETTRASATATLTHQAASHAARPSGRLHWGWLVVGGSCALLVLGGLGVHAGMRHVATGSANVPAGPAASPAPTSVGKTKPGHGLEELVLGGESLIPGIARALAQAPLALAATQPFNAIRTGAIQAKPVHLGATVTPALSSTQEIDPSTFLREAKALFMRLTTASSAQDQAELFRLVMPEALQELQSHIAPAGPHVEGVNFLTLDAQLLRAGKSDAALSVADQAEVRFCGLYSTAQQATASAFDCVWSLVFDRGIWRLHGIQAL